MNFNNNNNNSLLLLLPLVLGVALAGGGLNGLNGELLSIGLGGVIFNAICIF